MREGLVPEWAIEAVVDIMADMFDEGFRFHAELVERGMQTRRRTCEEEFDARLDARDFVLSRMTKAYLNQEVSW